MTGACVVMGVSGCGKSTVGSLLAERLGWSFLEADDLHPDANIVKMAAGIALTDADREPWLEEVGSRLAVLDAAGVVAACSALRRSYRDSLRDHVPDLAFVQLTGTPDQLRARLQHRAGHFMPASLLDSQLATLEPLEPDETGITVSIELPVDDQVAAALGRLASD